jgi:hypothetical protein
MEALSPLSSRHSSRSSRRSFPNLNHLSLAPLSSHFPIDDDGYDESSNVQLPPRSSYIQGKSAPSTPCILASNSKPPRPKIKKQSYAHESYFPPVQGLAPRAPLPKAKSASSIATHRQDAAAPLHGRALSPPRIRGDDEWLHRAGVVIAAETREYKGQSWLTSRESSTSLVRGAEEDDEEDGTTAIGDGEGRVSQRPSRPGSRVASARQSRRGSRTGSRVDFAALTSPRTPGARAAAEELLAEDAALAMEPDFVLKDDRRRGVDDLDEEEEEAEVERLARVRGSGLGGFVDRLVGWPLFDVDEDSEDDPTAVGGAADDEVDASTGNAEARRLARVRVRREALARTADGSAAATVAVVEPPRMEEQGGWNDVAWLLSVASKVML